MKRTPKTPGGQPSDSTDKGPWTVKAGSVVVKVYRYKDARGDGRFQVSDYTTGTRRLRTFSSLEEAKVEAERIGRFLARGDSFAAGFGSADRASLARAKQLLEPTGVALEMAIGAFVEAFGVLGGNRVVEAAKYFASRSKAILQCKAVAEAVQEMVEDKLAKGARVRHVDDLRTRLRRFAEDFKVQVAAPSESDLQHWLDRQKFSPANARNFRRVLSNFFNWCIRRGYRHSGDNPADGLDTGRVQAAETGIFTADEFRRLLLAAAPDFRCLLAIGGLAGLRPNECQRLDWSDVDLANRTIRVGASQAKTRSRRIVPICDSLASWLQPHAKPSGALWTGKGDRYSKIQKKIAETAGVEWRFDALRHSYATHRLTLIKNEGQVAAELGNSPDVVHKHYRALSTESAAQAWFNVRLESDAGVIPMTITSTA